MIFWYRFMKTYRKQLMWDKYMKHKGSAEEWSRFVNDPNRRLK